jgi:hypothetical protein
MPKNLINYSNTIFYKICCKNPNVNDVYVGYTTNLIKRKYQHKNSYENNENKPKLHIYNTIRDNGGWNNWDIIELGTFNLNNSLEARLKEQEFYNNLINNTNNDNKIEKTKFCNLCNKQYENTCEFNKHLCKKYHTDKILTNTAKKTPKKPQNFYCQTCDFITCNKKDYTRHLFTPKHTNTAKILTNTYINTQKTQKNPTLTFSCECGKKYKHRQSLFNHKKKCTENQTINIINENNEVKIDIDKDDLIKYLMKENSEFKDMIIEQNKMVMKIYENTGTSINNSNINSHNKTFNLNVFLNEHCKDAMNITDFVDSLKLQLSDLENVGRLGFVQGISNIIVKNLKALDVHKRPVHCSDSKREVMYVKDENKWEKENDDKNKLRKAIKKIANKNSKLLPIFKEKYPDCGKSTSKYSDQYNKLIVEAMGGSGNEDIDNENKIIKKIAKEVTIDKNID